MFAQLALDLMGQIIILLIIPREFAVDGNGNIYVSDYGNYQVQEYAANGTYIRTLGVTVIG